jgi:protein TonB
MTYLARAHDPRRRTAAIGGVIAIHTVLAIGLLNGLDVDFERIIDTRVGATNIPLDPPPPPDPPKQQEQQQAQNSAVTVPPTPYNPPAKTDDWVVVDPPLDDSTLYVDPRPVIKPSIEPAVTPTFTPSRVRPRNQPSSWLSTDDYPRAPLVDGIEGTAAYRLIVGTNGRVSACEITRSTGNGQLDAATCKFIERRARFEPATDQTGAKVVGSYTGTVTWEIPE